MVLSSFLFYFYFFPVPHQQPFKEVWDPTKSKTHARRKSVPVVFQTN